MARPWRALLPALIAGALVAAGLAGFADDVARIEAFGDVRFVG